MNPLQTKLLAGQIRHALTWVGGVMVGAGWVTSGQAAELMGAFLAVAGFALSAAEKHFAADLSAAQQNQISGLVAALQAQGSGQGPAD